MSTRHRLVEAPTLYLDEEEFKDPIGFLSQPPIIALAEMYGILKIVPPRGWRPKFSINEDKFKFHTRLQNLRELNLQNRPKIFFFESLNNYLSMTGKDMLDEEEIVLSNGAKIDWYALFQITEFERKSDPNNKGINWHRVNGFLGLDPVNSELPKMHDLYLKGYAQYLSDKKHLLSKARTEFTETQETGKHCMVCLQNDDPQHTLICDGCDETYHMKCLNPPLKKIPTNDWFCDSCLVGTFDYGFEEDFKSLFTIKEFKKYCQNFENDFFQRRFGSTTKPPLEVLEKEFWRLVDGSNTTDWEKDLEMRYGADIHNSRPDEISGFPTESNPNLNLENPQITKYTKHPFNLTNLPFANGSLLNYIKDAEISGMTVPWIYVGSLFSTFCWHKEDHYTLSSNYCHFGSTKKWYGIPAKNEALFEKILIESSPEYFQRQPDLLHQLITLLSPNQIFDRAGDNDMTIVYANQNENEFIITFPKVYHAGFNSGLNFNEAVNFTMPYWVKDAQSAITDYKKVHKENVFDYFQLSRRILNQFTELTLSEIALQDKRYFGGYSEMIKLCLNDFDHEFTSSVLMGKKVLSEVPSIKQEKYVKKPVVEPVKRRGRKKKATHDDELLCDVCKTYLSFKWVEITDEEPAPESDNVQLMTPDQTPTMQSERSCEEAEFQKIISDARKNQSEVGLGIKTRHSSRSASVSDEPEPKRRRSTREASKEQISTVLAKETSSKANQEPLKMKLCLSDFISMVYSKGSDPERKLLRHFEAADLRTVLDEYACLVYDSDEAENSQFVEMVGEKLKKTKESITVEN